MITERCLSRHDNRCEVSTALAGIPVNIQDSYCEICSRDRVPQAINSITISNAIVAQQMTLKRVDAKLIAMMPSPQGLANSEFLKEQNESFNRAWKELHEYAIITEIWNEDSAKKWVADWFNGLTFKNCNCAKNWATHSIKLDYSRREAFFESTIEVHSDISESIGKPRMSLADASAIYQPFWSVNNG